MHQIIRSIIVFVIIGPPIAFLTTAHNSGIGATILLALPFSYIFSPAAALAGGIHATACLIVINTLPFRRIDPIAGASIGLACGYLAMYATELLLDQSTSRTGSDFHRLFTGGVIAGGLCALIVHLKWPYQKTTSEAS